MLALPDQPELTAGEILDRHGIASKPRGFLAELRVFLASALDGLLERLELLTLFHRFEEPLLTDQRIDEHDAADQQQPIFDRTSTPTA